MTLIRNADAIRDRLVWAITAEQQMGKNPGPLREVVQHDLLPLIMELDPVQLLQIGMRAVVRDLQEWIEANDPPRDPAEVIPLPLLQSWLLCALITAGGSEDPVTNTLAEHLTQVVTDGQG